MRSFISAIRPRPGHLVGSCLSGLALLCAVQAPALAETAPGSLQGAIATPVQMNVPDLTPQVPDIPDLREEEPPEFEESPLDPGEVPPPPQVDAPDVDDGEAVEEAKPAKPDLDTLFTMLKEEDSDKARAGTAHSIQMLWLRSGSATVDLLMARAAKAISAKETALALDLLDAVVRYKPDYAAGWNRRAAAYFMAGDMGKALVDIERTLALEPRHWGALAGLAAIQQATDDDVGALRTYERILEIYPHQEKAEKAAEELRKRTGGVAL
ncbi:tetratricopeptide repeat protein [Breoghania sp.]|uniref:tetratricopeptide repeat protein n=1 Tax=Breoghania sp. TaxID=2065378 RepID=UPI002AA89FE0|nr:tetratricopeptide repeat protein [Breoghania sp.]